MDLNNQVALLFQEQVENWNLAKTNYHLLEKVKTRTFSFGEVDIQVKYNPSRIASVTAKTDEKSIAERPCFLCPQNLPKEQQSVDTGAYQILVNPYPIFPNHFTLPRKEHTPQQIKPYFGDMLDFAKNLDDYLIFYNGPKCGASAPDHMHFQAGTKDFLPLYNDYKRLKSSYAVLLGLQEKVELYTLNLYLRTVLCIESESKEKSMDMFQKIYDKWKDGDEEPMMNIVCWYEDEKWYTFIFPRKRFRPWQFDTPDKDKRLLFSPGTVEMSGIFITSVEEDFNRITQPDIIDIYMQISKNL